MDSSLSHRFIWWWKVPRQNLSVRKQTAIWWTNATPLVHPVIKLVLHVAHCLDFMTHRIDRLLLPIGHRFIRHLRLHRFASGLHPAQLADGPSVHLMVPVELSLQLMYQILWCLHWCLFLCTVGSSDGALFFPFLSRFRPSKYILSYDFGFWYFCI
jgi:hypothetical protein